MKKMNKKGFTLMEVLIVVAIIAVLVAIAIPVVTGELEKAREATDLANIRAAYAEASIAVLTSETDTASVDSQAMVQVTKGWGKITSPKIGNEDVPEVESGDIVRVTIDANGAVSFTVNP